MKKKPKPLVVVLLTMLVLSMSAYVLSNAIESDSGQARSIHVDVRALPFVGTR
jgi:hypothetical protein